MTLPRPSGCMVAGSRRSSADMVFMKFHMMHACARLLYYRTDCSTAKTKTPVVHCMQ